MFQCFGHCFDNTNNYGRSQVGKRHVEFVENSYQQLSPEEKELVLRDLYGLNTQMEETDEFVNEKLDELAVELNQLSNKIKSAYNQAIDAQQSSHHEAESESDGDGGEEEEDYITSRKFRLMFLRADQFDARLAARRMTMHFKEKRALFGEEKLARRIKEDDLGEADKVVLQSGLYSFTGARDEIGRLIGFSHTHERHFEMNSINIKRAVFYLVCNAIENDEISQKYGIVGVSHDLEPWNIKNAAKLRKFMPFVRMVHRALPVRISSSHYCYNDPLIYVFLHVALVVQPKYVRDRIQFHCGKHSECMVELLEYGIHPNDTPFEADGRLRMNLVLDYLKVIKEQSEIK